MTPENENYLEGLRDEDRDRQVDKALARRTSDENWMAGSARGSETRRNWREITPESEDSKLVNVRASLEDRVLGIRKPAKKIPNESEFLPGMSTQEMYPIKDDDYNVSKQLVEHVNRLSTLSARRQPTDYHVDVAEGTFNTDANLVHTPTGKKVGNVNWISDGHVDNLEVDEGHRHMTNYLLTQAWNHSRAKSEAGPASSYSLSPFSEKIVRKYNRDSHGFRKFEEEKSATCGNCHGDGELRLKAEPMNDGTHVRYVDSTNEVRDIVENNPINKGYFLRTAAHRYNITWQGGGQGIHNPKTGDSHWWHDYQITCPRCAFDHSDEEK